MRWEDRMDERGSSFVAIRRLSNGIERGSVCHSTSAEVVTGSTAWIGRGLSCVCAQGRESDARVSFELTPMQEDCFLRLRNRVEVTYDSSRHEHQEALRALWSAAFPEGELRDLISDQWKQMGWQGKDPSTDFRGGGFISLENLLFFAKSYPATWITLCPLLLLDTRMPYGSFSLGCEEHLDPAGTGSLYNEGEADIVAQHVFSLVSAGVSPTAVAVQSPYVAQVQLLRDRLEELPEASGVEVSTIDSFQGREADAVVISMVRSNSLGAVGFLGDSRRMNVAITRARKHVAVVCDSSTICHNTFLARLLRHIRYFGKVKNSEPGSFGDSGLDMNPMMPLIS